MMKKILTVLLAAMLFVSLSLSAFAASGSDIYDDADLLTPAEQTRLAGILSDLGDRYDAQIVIATVPTCQGSIDAYVEYVYDVMDMGFGANRDGVLLLVCMDTREYRILSNGYAAEAIGASQIDAIGDAIVSDLSDGNYADAFLTFTEKCAYYLDGYLNGFPFPAGRNLLIALVVGIAVGVAAALILKQQLKSVRQQKQANVYIKSGSMQVTDRRDLFLYRQVSRTQKQSTNSSGSGSSRNVGGGSF